MALEHAPGLLREHHGFQAWPAVAEADWQALVAEAEARRQQSLEGLHIAGFDSDHGAIQAAKENAHRAGVGDAVEFTRRQLAKLTREDFAAEKGLLVANPPWGERLEEQEQAGWLYYALGRTLARFASQWQALLDRKSTRLNSSHVSISYAVFCLKKKKSMGVVELCLRGRSSAR